MVGDYGPNPVNSSSGCRPTIFNILCRRAPPPSVSLCPFFPDIDPCRSCWQSHPPTHCLLSVLASDHLAFIDRGRPLYMMAMTSIPPLPPSIIFSHGCRSSWDRPVFDLVHAIEQHLPRSMRCNMQSHQSSSGDTATTQDRDDMASWQPLPRDSNTDQVRLVMMFATGRQHYNSAARDQTPFVFFPCHLDISPFEGVPQHLGLGSFTSDSGKLESVAIPGDMVGRFLSRPLPLWQGRSVMLGSAHFDDNDTWVFSRCTLAGFSEMSSYEAETLSRTGRLGCWASVTLTRQASGRWDLGFLVHRLVVTGDQ